MEDIIFMWAKIVVFISIALFVIIALIFLIIEQVQEKRIDKELYEKYDFTKQTTVYKTSEEDITELIDEIKDHQKKINILLNRIEREMK